MSDLRKAAEMALEVFDGPVLKDATEHAMRLRKACDLLRQALTQPEWAGLTNKERMDIFKSNEDLGFDNLYCAIECALREKNHG